MTLETLATALESWNARMRLYEQPEWSADDFIARGFKPGADGTWIWESDNATITIRTDGALELFRAVSIGSTYRELPAVV